MYNHAKSFAKPIAVVWTLQLLDLARTFFSYLKSAQNNESPLAADLFFPMIGI